MEAVRALLPVLDDFERALKAESADKEYVKGMELIYQRFSRPSRNWAWSRLFPQGSPSIRTSITRWIWWRRRTRRTIRFLKNFNAGTILKAGCCGPRW